MAEKARMSVHWDSGGYLPFTIDITGTLKDKENELVVAVWDPSDADGRERGKQVLKPRSIWYTAISGIWQTVWLEAVPETSLASLRLTPDLDHRSLAVEASIRGDSLGMQMEVEAFSDGKSLALPLAQSKIFPQLMVDLVKIGEDTGDVPGALKNVADTYENELAIALRVMTNMIEPVLIIVMAIGVGFLLMSVLSAMFAITSNIAR